MFFSVQRGKPDVCIILASAVVSEHDGDPRSIDGGDDEQADDDDGATGATGEYDAADLTSC